MGVIVLLLLGECRPGSDLGRGPATPLQGREDRAGAGPAPRLHHATPVTMHGAGADWLGSDGPEQLAPAIDGAPGSAPPSSTGRTPSPPRLPTLRRLCGVQAPQGAQTRGDEGGDDGAPLAAGARVRCAADGTCEGSRAAAPQYSRVQSAIPFPAVPSSSVTPPFPRPPQ